MRPGGRASSLEEAFMTDRGIWAAFVLAMMLFIPSSTAAQATTVFAGLPQVKISEGGVGRAPENVSGDRAVNFACVISRIGDKYYWASRENKEMIPIAGGAFITFLAVDGAGYVRIVAPGMKGAVSVMGDTESRFDYAEHALIGLRSVTYYGVTR